MPHEDRDEGNILAPLQVSGLLKIAAKAGRLVNEVSREPEAYVIAGRLVRLAEVRGSGPDEQRAIAFAEAIVLEAKTEKCHFADHPNYFYVLDSAIAQVSYRIWEDLWNDKHPDCFGQAWEGEDFALMAD